MTHNKLGPANEMMAKQRMILRRELSIEVFDGIESKLPILCKNCTNLSSESLDLSVLRLAREGER